MKNELNIEEIKNLIPHRYPFLLIDKIINIVPFESAIGIKNVTINENFFQGHFENMAVMPGALIIESMAQAAGSLVLHSLGKTSKNISELPLFIDSIPEHNSFIGKDDTHSRLKQCKILEEGF